MHVGTIESIDAILEELGLMDERNKPVFRLTYQDDQAEFSTSWEDRDCLHILGSEEALVLLASALLSLARQKSPDRELALRPPPFANTVGLGSTITRFWLPNDDGFGPPFPIV